MQAAGMYILQRRTKVCYETLNPIAMEPEETSSARVERVHAELAICRYRPGARVDAAALGENLEARMRHPGREAHAVIAIFPEDVDFDMVLLEKNHYTDLSLNEVTKVLAIVATGALYERIAGLYALNQLATASNRVFRTEAEARVWVEERIGVYLAERAKRA